MSGIRTALYDRDRAMLRDEELRNAGLSAECVKCSICGDSRPVRQMVYAPTVGNHSCIDFYGCRARYRRNEVDRIIARVKGGEGTFSLLSDADRAELLRLLEHVENYLPSDARVGLVSVSF